MMISYWQTLWSPWFIQKYFSALRVEPAKVPRLQGWYVPTMRAAVAGGCENWNCTILGRKLPNAASSPACKVTATLTIAHTGLHMMTLKLARAWLTEQSARPPFTSSSWSSPPPWAWDLRRCLFFLAAVNQRKQAIYYEEALKISP